MLSILSNFPMQMLPYRESLTRLVGLQDLTGITYSAVTYSSLGIFYLVAMSAKSIWTPLQLVGATAGALIAFFIPATLALRIVSIVPEYTHGYGETAWKVSAWLVIALGVVQLVTGLIAVLLQ